MMAFRAGRSAHDKGRSHDDRLEPRRTRGRRVRSARRHPGSRRRSAPAQAPRSVYLRERSGGRSKSPVAEMRLTGGRCNAAPVAAVRVPRNGRPSFARRSARIGLGRGTRNPQAAAVARASSFASRGGEAHCFRERDNEKPRRSGALTPTCKAPSWVCLSGCDPSRLVGGLRGWDRFGLDVVPKPRSE
jgi:hypothetical protein